MYFWPEMWKSQGNYFPVDMKWKNPDINRDSGLQGIEMLAKSDSGILREQSINLSGKTDKELCVHWVWSVYHWHAIKTPP